MNQFELLDTSVRKSLLHVAIFFDIREDISAITAELSGYGGGYADTIAFAESRMEADPEGILQMLQETLEIARALDDPKTYNRPG